MSYIVNNKNEVIAKTEREIKSGTVVKVATSVCKETLDANREFNLVNSVNYKISNSKKSQNYFLKNGCWIAR